ncbi:YhgE/Pip N-terminal domain protein [Paenibacillus algicola]|uniref:YhgE/Pip N-terminal domain protein n=1 Tax=Paenibacillus algicola TaxID=2565926 RepID=A0A4P8XQI6_9BACL|nr:YhgE/Pip domain-containing protein [Paenibacillus algicola]QCT04100.1 YhgE/Pip N-terminal domain protein [Paenibacillus algicola]
MNVFFKDVGAALRNRKLLIPLIAVLFIPIMYSGMFLGAFWDPYGKMEQLPVAVVNDDLGAEFEGKTLTVGEDLVAELKKGGDFNWQFVSREEAETGMINNEYYMTIVIPEQFSKQATTVLDEQPQPAKLIFEPNEGYNFLAGQIGGSAVKQIQSSVSAKVTEAYTETLFQQVQDLAGGLSEAGQGASELSDGAVKLDEGALKLKDNLSKLVSGTEELRSGVAPLAQGVQEVAAGTSSLDGGAKALASGLSQLLAAQKELQAGAEDAAGGGTQLAAGIERAASGSRELTAGLEASRDGAAALQAGAQSAANGAESLENGLAQSQEGAKSLQEGAEALAGGLQQLSESNEQLAALPELQQLLAASQELAAGTATMSESQEQLRAGAAKLKAGTAELSEGAGRLNTGAEELLQGSKELSGGSEQLLAGAKSLTAGQEQLSAGIKQFGSKLGEAAQGSLELADGAASLKQGTLALSEGADKLGSGVGRLADGSKELDAGAGELVSGMNSLTSGSGTLAARLNEAAEQAGAVQATDSTYTMFAGPVEVEEQKVNEVPNYGTGFAPYFLSLGLFVGALITSIVMPVVESSVPGAGGLSRLVSRTLSFAAMGVIQALLAVLLLIYGLDLEVQNVPMFYGFAIITSLSYMLLIQALVTWLDLPGRFVAIVILILQLTTSAGTFPLELIPDWMRLFNPLLPMTYSVAGFKAVISTGDVSVIWSNTLVLSAFGGGCLVLTAVYFLTNQYKKRVNPTPAITAVQ